MAVTFTQYPTYPVKSKPVRIGFAASVGDYVKVYLTGAPRKSKLFEQLEKSSASQVLTYEGDARKPWTFAPDASGKFTFSVQDISKGASSHGGSYQGDTEGYRSETVNSTSSLEIIIGSRLTVPVGAGEDTGTLVWFVWDDTVRATNEETHGEATPAIIDASSERLEFAARTSTVTTNLAAMVGCTSAQLLQSRDLEDWSDELITDFTAHAASTSYHYTADTDNAVDASYKTANNPGTFAQVVARVAALVDRHITNDDGTGVGASDYHQDGSGNKKVMHEDRAPVSGAGTPADAFRLLCAALLAYDTHVDRGLSEGHKVADAANRITTPGPGTLISVHQSVLVELAKTAPTAPATANPAATTLAATVGATET